MQFSKATLLALHSVMMLAGAGDELLSTAQMAKSAGVSEAHLAKVLQRLGKAGLVRSVRGPKGGFSLARPAEEMTLLDVYEAMEGMSTMFCYQCEQTAGGKACSSFGVCGKDPETSALQDLLVYAVEGLAMYGRRIREAGGSTRTADRFVTEALFATLTNVNYDPKALQELIHKAAELKEELRQTYQTSAPKATKLSGPADFQPAQTPSELVPQGQHWPAASTASTNWSLGTSVVSPVCWTLGSATMLTRRPK